MTVQSGPYAGGVHQTTASYERIYPGPSFQLADAEWKMGRVDKALWHYEAAMSPVGSAVGLGCRVVDDTYDDGFVGGFIDWVVDDGDPPPPPHIWQRFVDTSAYMIVATEELFFDNEVDWSLRGRIFDDVPITYWAWPHIDAIAEAGITTGCGPDLYCPENLVSRAEMAVFLLRGIYRIRCYTPPEPTGTRFSDVPASFWATAWIEQLAAEGITQGCGGGRYCPNNTVTRAEMAVFLLRSKHGSGYQPPPATGTEFKDVPRSHWAAAWIEQLAAEEITGGCGNGNYCPDNSVTRAQMAVFLARTFNLPLP